MKLRLPRLRPFAILSLLVAAVLAILVFGSKVSAQPAPKKPALGGAAPKIALKVDVAEPPASEPMAADAAAPTVAEPKDKDEGFENPPTFATTVTRADGGVPVQTRGPYRSPFSKPDAKVATARVGVLLARVNSYDIREGTFEADFYLTLTSDNPMPENLELDLPNGKLDSKDKLASTPTFRMFRIQGTFSSPADIHDYPFDTQELRIEVESQLAGTDQLKLVADKTHTDLDDGFSVPGWDTAYVEARTMTHYYPDRFDDDDLYYSQYIFNLGVKRFGTSAAFSVFVPAFVIVLISLFGLWLPRDELEVRTNAGAPMLAAAVLFHFTLTQALPPTAYLTRADKLMMAVYVSLLLNIFASWCWFIFDEKHVERIERLGRFIVVPITILIMTLGCTL